MGKTGDIICGEADAIGYVSRQGNKTLLSFKGGDNNIRGSRPLHLREKTFRSALETVEHYSFRQHVYNNEPTIVLNNLANNMQIVAMA